jgi:hypothetical protein
MTHETIEMLKRLASKRTSEDEGLFNAMESSGGNFDDAYGMGLTRGEILLARQVLQMEGIEHDPR